MTTDTTMTILAPGETLDHYRIDAVIARTGMSVLYRATDLTHDRQVAIKIPHPEMEADPVLFERFKREGRSANCWLPPGLFDGVMRFFGVDRTMDEFAGRRNETESQMVRPSRTDRARRSRALIFYLDDPKVRGPHPDPGAP